MTSPTACATSSTSIIPRPSASASCSTICRPTRPPRSTRPCRPSEARRILRRLEFHYTPKHASWLNMVEIEIGVLRSQCLDRRIDSHDTPRRGDRRLGTPAKRQRRPHQLDVLNRTGPPQNGHEPIQSQPPKSHNLCAEVLVGPAWAPKAIAVSSEPVLRRSICAVAFRLYRVSCTAPSLPSACDPAGPSAAPHSGSERTCPAINGHY